MTIDDEKLAFFSRHWQQIAEWTALLRHAANVLDKELLDALKVMREDGDTPFPEIKEGNPRVICLHVGRGREAWIELNWGRAHLIEEKWPSLVVVWNADRSTPQGRQAVRSATHSLGAQQGLTTSHPEKSWWIWSGEIRPVEETFDVDNYVTTSIERFRTAWKTMHSPIEVAIARAHEANVGHRET